MTLDQILDLGFEGAIQLAQQVNLPNLADYQDIISGQVTDLAELNDGMFELAIDLEHFINA